MIDKSSIVFTRIKTALETKYGEGQINIGSTAADAPSKFPAASIQQIGAPVVSSSYTCRQHGCISTIEVQVWSEKSLKEAKDIMYDIADEMDKMAFSLIYGIQEIPQASNIKRCTARFRRTIGAGDTI